MKLNKISLNLCSSFGIGTITRFPGTLASFLTRTVHSKTLPIGMMDYLDEFTINWAGMCAIAVVMIIPALILTFIVQKHLVSGLTFGGVKG